jgi:hypothetical protein
VEPEGAADEAVLNKVHRRKKIQKIPLLKQSYKGITCTALNRDAVELNLSSEVDNIKNIQNKMLSTLEQVRIGGLVINTWGQHQREVLL